MHRTKSQSSEMDVLALDPATTEYLQARGHQEALVAALEGPDLSHGLDRADRVGGEGRGCWEEGGTVSSPLCSMSCVGARHCLFLCPP